MDIIPVNSHCHPYVQQNPAFIPKGHPFISKGASRNYTHARAAAASLIAPMVYADDGGIRENGGWGSVTGGSLLRDALISRGMPASLVALMGSLIASLSSHPSVWGGVENLESYAEQSYPGANRTGGVVDYGDDSSPGLPQSVIDAEDSEHYGDGMKIYTQPVPADQGQMDDISEGITNLGTAVTNNLHPEGMEKPYHRGENRGAEQNK